MSSSKISITPIPAGPTGWFGRVLASVGVLMVIAAGIAISPAARSAGLGWTESTRTIPVVQPTAANDRSNSIESGSEVRHVVRPLRSPPRTGLASPEPVGSNDARRFDRPSLARRLMSAVIDRTKAELDRLRGAIVTASAD
jgi:hypothetical protein